MTDTTDFTDAPDDEHEDEHPRIKGRIVVDEIAVEFQDLVVVKLTEYGDLVIEQSPDNCIVVRDNNVETFINTLIGLCRGEAAPRIERTAPPTAPTSPARPPICAPTKRRTDNTVNERQARRRLKLRREREERERANISEGNARPDKADRA